MALDLERIWPTVQINPDTQMKIPQSAPVVLLSTSIILLTVSLTTQTTVHHVTNQTVHKNNLTCR